MCVIMIPVMPLVVGATEEQRLACCRLFRLFRLIRLIFQLIPVYNNNQGTSTKAKWQTLTFTPSSTGADPD